MEGSNIVKKLLIALNIIAALLLTIMFVTYLVFAVQIANYNNLITYDKPEKTISVPLSSDVEKYINEFRLVENLPTFNTEVPALDKAAQARAEGMCIEKDWSHSKDWQVLDQYYTYQYAGENLYYGWLQEDQASIAVRDWANSPSHLENLVGEYTEIGVGVKYCPGFENEPTAVIITNYFGVPR